MGRVVGAIHQRPNPPFGTLSIFLPLEEGTEDLHLFLLPEGVIRKKGPYPACRMGRGEREGKDDNTEEEPEEALAGQKLPLQIIRRDLR